MSIDPNDYKCLVRLLEEKCGIEIEPGKEYLFESRLSPVAQSLGLDGIPALVVALRRSTDGTICKQIVEAMTTHESLFFRDTSPYMALANGIVPLLVQMPRIDRTLRIWSAGCSAGQEPYSIAMTLLDLPAFNSGWSFSILATDVSSAILKKATSGVYSDLEVQRGCSGETLVRYFQKVEKGWQLQDRVRGHVRFEQANLLDPVAADRSFDVIFCRNVLIYFNVAAKAQALRLLARALSDKGHLILGGTESVYGVSDEFALLEGTMTGVYTHAARRAA